MGVALTAYYFLMDDVQGYATSHYHDVDSLIEISVAIHNRDTKDALAKLNELTDSKLEILHKINDNFDDIMITFYSGKIVPEGPFGLDAEIVTKEPLTKLLPQLVIEHKSNQNK
jgi:hypothetical protein